MADELSERTKRLMAVTPERLEDAYRNGLLTAGQRNDLLREKAHADMEGLLTQHGYLQALWQRTIAHVQQGWDNLKEAIVREPSKGTVGEQVKGEAYYAALAVWGQIELVYAGFAAVADVTGVRVEQLAREAGASPGLARTLNIASSLAVPTTGYATGKTAQSFAKTVQHVGKAAKYAKPVGQAAEAAAPKAEQAEPMVKAMGEGLKTEGMASIAVEKALGKEAGASIKSKYTDWFEQVSLKMKQEDTGQAVLDNLDEVGRTPNHVLRDFLNTYNSLPEAVQKRFQKYAFRMTGFKPGSVIAVDKEGNSIIANTWEDVFKATDLGDSIEHLEGIDRGFVALMEMANIRKASGKGFETVAQKLSAPDIIETTAKASPLNATEQFLSDLNTFRQKMQRITKVQAHEETAAMAERLGLSLDDLKNVVPGQALNEKEMYAYLKALEPQMSQLTQLAERVTVDPSPQNIEALAQHASEVFTVAPIFRGAEVTAGRSVEILKETPPMKKLTDLLAGWDPDKMAKGDFNGAMQTFAEDLLELSTQPDKLTALAIQSQSGFARKQAQWWPMAREVYINLLLSRPLTQVRNTIGNSIAVTNEVLDRVAGGAFSIDKDKGLVAGEGVYFVKGLTNSIRDGMKAFAEAYTRVTPEEASKLDYVPHQVPGTLGRILNVPGDTLRGMDNLFKTIIRRASYYAEALRDASHKGFNAAGTSEFVARRIANPTVTMIENGEELAKSLTFQGELGHLGQAAQKLQTGPLALWFPFMKTPINLAKYAWNRTPGLQLLSQSLYEDILAGGVRADRAIGKLTISNLQAMFLFNLAQEGLITGSGPVDPGLRKSWLATHQPYSVQTKDGWKPISNMEPGSTAVGLMADYAQVMNQLDDPTAEQGAMAITFSIMKNLADKTYWQTAGELVELTAELSRGQQPVGSATKILESPLITVASGGPLGAATARILDPVAREARGFVDQITARVPGYSQTLPPKRDGYGDPILPPQTIGSPWLAYVSPLTNQPYQTDPIKLEGSKLGVHLPTFPDHIGGAAPEDFDIREPQPGDRYGVALAPQQRDRWQQLYRNLLRHPEFGIEKQVLSRKEYQEAMPAMKRETFESYLRGIKSTALDALQVEDAELGKNVLAQDAQTQRAFVPLQQQRQYDERVNESLGLFDRLSKQERDNLLRWGIYEPTP